jgi:hypothetical protein
MCLLIRKSVSVCMQDAPFVRSNGNVILQMLDLRGLSFAIKSQSKLAVTNYWFYQIFIGISQITIFSSQ